MKPFLRPMTADDVKEGQVFYRLNADNTISKGEIDVLVGDTEIGDCSWDVIRDKQGLVIMTKPLYIEIEPKKTFIANCPPFQRLERDLDEDISFEARLKALEEEVARLKNNEKA